jgi:phosphonate transport system substrate-binding protein
MPLSTNLNHNQITPEAVRPDTIKRASQPIWFASFLGDNAVKFYRQVVDYLSLVTTTKAELLTGLTPHEKDCRVNSGEIGAVFTCGLPYVRKADLDPPLLRLIAAPVMNAPRYQNRPVYFSDIIVRANSPYHTLADLKGSTFAYNEVHSLSGYVLPCYHLFQLGLRPDFFGQMLPSGSHAVSMDWVESGHVTAAAIDSVVLDMELAQRPQRAGQFRVVDTAGPLPMPPVAASPGLTEAHLQQFRQALLAMHTTPRGRTILRGAGVQHFAPVKDSHYNPIRQIVATLRQAGITGVS